MQNPRFIGRQIVILESTGSTNDYLSGMLQSDSGLPEGTVVRAKFQTRGRGQRGNTWESDEGRNLLISLLLYPSFIDPSDQFMLSMVVALGARETMATYSGKGDEVKVKWPNDIYFSNKKLGGILIECVLRGSMIQSCIAGIGLNINQRSFGDQLSRATSLACITGEEIQHGPVFERLIANIEARYISLKNGNEKAIRDEYYQHLDRRGVMATYKTAEGELEGVIVGVDDAGRLLLETAEGIRKFELKEIGY